MDVSDLKEQLDCFGRHDILRAAMGQGLNFFSMNGCAPQQLCADETSMCATQHEFLKD
jgi:hypothetical protein